MNMPLAVSTNGTVGVMYVPAFVDYLHPKLTEIKSAGSLDLSCYLTGDGLNTDVNENNIDDPRLCSKQTFESPGDFTRTLELTYVYNPDSPIDDKARIALARGVRGFIAIRWAIDTDQAWAVGDLIDVYPVQFGAQKKQTPARNGVHRIMQKPFVTGSMAEDVALVA